MSAIVKREAAPAQVPMTTDVAAVMGMIERAAANKDIDVAKLEKLLDMQERIFNKNAEMAFNSAMAEMQPELPVIRENGVIEITGRKPTRYAKFEDINEQVKPILQKHGFAITFRTNTTNNKVIVVGILTHRQGHREQTEMELPVDTSGSKNAVQAVGSSTQYGKRYVMEALLNLTSRGQDDDGTGAGKGCLSEEQFQSFKKAIEATLTKKEAKEQWALGVQACQKVGDLETAERLKEVLLAHGKFIDEATKAK